MIELEEPKTAEEALQRARDVRMRLMGIKPAPKDALQEIRKTNAILQQARDEVETVATAIASLSHGLECELPFVTVSNVVRIISDVWSIPRVDLISERRAFRVAKARQCGCWIAKRFTTASYPIIAARFGRRDHTTALYAARFIQTCVDRDRISPSIDTPLAWAWALHEAFDAGQLGRKRAIGKAGAS